MRRKYSIFLMERLWKTRKEKQQAEVQSEKEAKDDAVFSEIEQDFGVKEWEGEI